ncbi:MAG TPA: cytochrome c [Bacteroidota bacterium]|nr:cytochrome c [Bacteroidota bacterium]
MTEHESKYREEIEWRDLLRQPKKLFGYSYLYVLIILVIIGLLYLVNLNTIGKNTIAPTAQDTTVMIKDLPLQTPRVIPPIDVMRTGVASAEAIAKGKELYKTNCVSCHGDNGAGDGAAAAMLNPKPRNFTSSAGWKNGTKVSQMYKTIDAGIPGSGMTSFNFLLPADRFAIIHYIRTLLPGQPNDSQDELKQLDAAFHLSEGVNISGQIPVKKAMTIVVKESVPENIAIQHAIQKFDGDSSESAQLLRSVIGDETKAFTVLLYQEQTMKPFDECMTGIAESPISSGFKPEITRLSIERWNDLYRYTHRILQEEHLK